MRGDERGGRHPSQTGQDARQRGRGDLWAGRQGWLPGKLAHAGLGGDPAWEAPFPTEVEC